MKSDMKTRIKTEVSLSNFKKKSDGDSKRYLQPTKNMKNA